MVGTMIEVPRAAVTANQIAEVAEFFSFGTNDLTQMTLGFSRDDIAKFLPIYLDKGLIKADPFQTLDQNGVGQLVKTGVFKGRDVKPQAQMRHLRRTRRRTFVGGVLPLRRSELRELLSVPRAHRMAGCRPCRPEITAAYTTDRAGRPLRTARPVCTPSRQQVRGRPSRRTDSRSGEKYRRHTPPGIFRVL